MGQEGLQREEYEDLLNYLGKKYQIFINAKAAQGNNGYESQI